MKCNAVIVFAVFFMTAKDGLSLSTSVMDATPRAVAPVPLSLNHTMTFIANVCLASPASNCHSALLHSHRRIQKGGGLSSDSNHHSDLPSFYRPVRQMHRVQTTVLHYSKTTNMPQVADYSIVAPCRPVLRQAVSHTTSVRTHSVRSEPCVAGNTFGLLQAAVDTAQAEPKALAALAQAAVGTPQAVPLALAALDRLVAEAQETAVRTPQAVPKSLSALDRLVAVAADSSRGGDSQ